MHALYNLQGLQTIGQLAEFFQQNTTTTAQASATQNAQIMNGISKKEELRILETGVFHYEFHGAVGSFHQTVKFGSPVSMPGTVDTRLTIDFGGRAIGGSGSWMTVDTQTASTGNINQTVALPAQSFATGTGTAVFTAPSNVLPVTMTLENVNGMIAEIVGFTSRNEGDITPAIFADRQSGA